VNNANDLNSIFGRTIKNQIVANRKSAQLRRQIKATSAHLRLTRDQRAFLLNRKQQPGSGVWIIHRNEFFDFFQVPPGLNRELNPAHGRGRRRFFSSSASMTALPSSNSPRLDCSIPTAIFSRNSTMFERMNSSCARNIPRLWATTSAAER